MELKKLIVHQLDKISRNEKDLEPSEPVLYLSKHCLEPVETTIKLISNLVEKFNKDNITHAVFKEEEGHRFQEELDRYLASPRAGGDFRELTKELMFVLRDAIRNLNFATGGFLVFSEYESSRGPYISVFLVRKSEEGFNITLEGEDFTIENIPSVDISKLAMAGRVSLSIYEDRLNQKTSYLSFVGHQKGDASKYFYDWFSADQKVTSKQVSNRFRLEVLNKIPYPSDPDRGMQITSRDHFRQEFLAYVRKQQNMRINLRQFSEHFYGNPDTVPDFIIDNGIDIDSEFRFSKEVAKNMEIIDVNVDDVRLRFNLAQWGDTVTVGSHGSDTIMIRSKPLAEALWAQIDEHKAEPNS